MKSSKATHAQLNWKPVFLDVGEDDTIQEEHLDQLEDGQPYLIDIGGEDEASEMIHWRCTLSQQEGVGIETPYHVAIWKAETKKWLIPFAGYGDSDSGCELEWHEPMYVTRFFSPRATANQ